MVLGGVKSQHGRKKELMEPMQSVIPDPLFAEIQGLRGHELRDCFIEVRPIPI